MNYMVDITDKLDKIIELYLVELKIWRGEEYYQKGLKQLSDYLDINELDCGYLIIYNFN
ncbi:hypothetical protein [Clostridium sp. 1001271B_151109_B4]|uniref:hypothetical protein n=1 Tax=Clostridium sp. 1001271B_151109_B4 TaxID=2787148 RepID=UPI0018A95A80|nr:hypothetical protein [Clostridium sp. 1001271B_151109_B4]